MRRSVIAGNWKMNLGFGEAADLVNSLTKLNYNTEQKDVIIAPSFVYLSELGKIAKDSNIKVYAQNFYYEDSGAFTGEVSIEMLKNIGVAGSIVGHSERRMIFHETDEVINKKIKAAVAHKFPVIFCVGETLEQRVAGVHEEVVTAQVGLGLEGISEKDMEIITIAYEPVWAIGTGKTASSDDAESMHKAIRNFLGKKYNKALADNVRILYGGSVKPENISELMAMENINGALVGGASLKADSFAKIINY
ncbi:triose-phosphate isomerase [Deferribacteraceae bacterium V6Fe1]|nr:triose-phosphate isomerase [Deferribacteraceae bacterium V6Fe1]